MGRSIENASLNLAAAIAAVGIYSAGGEWLAALGTLFLFLKHDT